MASESFYLGLGPAVCMLLCTIVGLGIVVPKNIAGALQHFAAGVLLSAIGSELLPSLIEAEGVWGNFCATIGFFGGMATLILLGMVLPEAHGHAEDSDDDDEDHGHNDQKVKSSLTESFRKGRQSLLGTGYSIEKDNAAAAALAAEDVVVHEGQPLVGGSTTAKAFPFVFFAAVLVDSFMDGVLIGIAAAAGAGPMMAGSLAVEMSFIGLTLATSLHGYPLRQSVTASVLGPIVLVLGAVLGGLLSESIKHDPALFAGLMGFGTSALLFMVAEELLLEAHEDDAGHVWWVDLQLYVGFYASFMATKFIE